MGTSETVGTVFLQDATGESPGLNYFGKILGVSSPACGQELLRR